MTPRREFSAATKRAVRDHGQKPPAKRTKKSVFDGVTCSNNWCGRSATIGSAGVPLCNRHYQHWRHSGDWNRPDNKTNTGVCCVDGCDRPSRTRHEPKCETHFYREYRDSDLGDAPIHPPCTNCGGDLSGTQSKYCNTKCRRDHQYSIMKVRLSRWNTAHKQRCKTAGLEYENVDLFEMFESENWTCYICELPIDPELRHPDPMSPSVDHEIALKAGGSHSRKNCRGSHLRCNLGKAHKHDAPRIAKVKRNMRKHQEHLDRVQGKTGQTKRRTERGPQIKSRNEWPKGRRLQSRGFGK